jgi:hypothetical protein
MTPEQYLAQAESLWATGHYYLARQYENLWLLRAGRQERPPAEDSTQ